MASFNLIFLKIRGIPHSMFTFLADAMFRSLLQQRFCLLCKYISSSVCLLTHNHKQQCRSLAVFVCCIVAFVVAVFHYTNNYLRLFTLQQITIKDSVGVLCCSYLRYWNCHTTLFFLLSSFHYHCFCLLCCCVASIVTVFHYTNTYLRLFIFYHNAIKSSV